MKPTQVHAAEPCSSAAASAAATAIPGLGETSTRDQRQIKVGSTFAQRLGGAWLGDAGGEETEIVGERAVGVVGDARSQNGDRLGR